MNVSRGLQPLCSLDVSRAKSEAHLPLRLHLHIGASLRIATAIIFVDIKAAYYTVVKEFFFDSTPEDGVGALRGLFRRLQLPPEAADDFISTVIATDLLAEADVPQVLRHLVQSTITASWFQIPGSDKICAPATGTRPGDPLADVLFAYVMSNVLCEAYIAFNKEGLTPWVDHPPGTTWADDTCILLAGECDKIEAQAAAAYSILQEILIKHGLSPTYGPKKTAIMINFRGKGAAHKHHQLYRREHPGVECVFEHGGDWKVDAVHVYKHLGSTFFYLKSRQEVWQPYRQFDPLRNVAWPMVQFLLLVGNSCHPGSFGAYPQCRDLEEATTKRI